MAGPRLAAIAALAVALGATALAIAAPVGLVPEERPLPRAGSSPDPPLVTASPPAPSPIRWRRSTAVGSPAAGRLVRGVRLPAEGRHFYTWDPVLKRSPNRPWRRWGTDRLVRVLLRVAHEYGRAHPDAPRLAVGDLSRPHGGDFGIRFGPIGHASHQNGLDADVYYPRSDGRERAPRGAGQIDRRLSQELVDRFTAAGAAIVFVGPATGLTGPRASVLANHDNHLHVRLGP
jgi:penicillin-insensitive murein endopeptidase